MLQLYLNVVVIIAYTHNCYEYDSGWMELAKITPGVWVLYVVTILMIGVQVGILGTQTIEPTVGQGERVLSIKLDAFVSLTLIGTGIILIALLSPVSVIAFLYLLLFLTLCFAAAVFKNWLSIVYWTWHAVIVFQGVVVLLLYLYQFEQLAQTLQRYWCCTVVCPGSSCSAGQCPDTCDKWDADDPLWPTGLITFDNPLRSITPWAVTLVVSVHLLHLLKELRLRGQVARSHRPGPSSPSQELTTSLLEHTSHGLQINDSVDFDTDAHNLAYSLMENSDEQGVEDIQAFSRRIEERVTTLVPRVQRAVVVFGRKILTFVLFVAVLTTRATYSKQITAVPFFTHTPAPDDRMTPVPGHDNSVNVAVQPNTTAITAPYVLLLLCTLIAPTYVTMKVVSVGLAYSVMVTLGLYLWQFDLAFKLFDLSQSAATAGDIAWLGFAEAGAMSLPQLLLPHLFVFGAFLLLCRADKWQRQWKDLGITTQYIFLDEKGKDPDPAAKAPSLPHTSLLYQLMLFSQFIVDHGLAKCSSHLVSIALMINLWHYQDTQQIWSLFYLLMVGFWIFPTWCAKVRGTCQAKLMFPACFLIMVFSVLLFSCHYFLYLGVPPSLSTLPFYPNLAAAHDFFIGYETYLGMCFFCHVCPEFHLP